MYLNSDRVICLTVHLPHPFNTHFVKIWPKWSQLRTTLSCFTWTSATNNNYRFKRFFNEGNYAIKLQRLKLSGSVEHSRGSRFSMSPWKILIKSWKIFSCCKPVTIDVKESRCMITWNQHFFSAAILFSAAPELFIMHHLFVLFWRELNIDSSRTIICQRFPIYQASVSNFRFLRDVWTLAIIHSRRQLIFQRKWENTSLEEHMISS